MMRRLLSPLAICTAAWVVTLLVTKQVPPALASEHKLRNNDLQQIPAEVEWNNDLRDLNIFIRHGTEYLVQHCHDHPTDATKHGKFTYLADIADPDRFATSNTYNLLRHSGAIYALGMSYARRPNKKVAQAMERAVTYLKTNGLGPVEPKAAELQGRNVPHGNLIAAWSTAKISGSASQKPTAKLGGAGLALIALTSYEHVKKKSTPLDTMQSLARFILFMQNQDGGFVSKYVPSRGGFDLSFISLYYPGEAALGLLSLYEIDPDPMWLSGAAKAIRYLYNLRKELPLSKIEPDHWALIATSKLMAALGGLDHQYCSIQEAVDHATQVCRSMVLSEEDLVANQGCLVGDDRTCPTSTRIEGLAAAMAFLPDQTPEQVTLLVDIDDNMDAGVRYLLRAQRTKSEVGDTDMIGSMPGVYPYNSERKNDSNEVRVDYVQHSLSGVIFYERERFHEGKVRVSMLRRVAEAIGWGLRRLVLTICAFALAIGVMLWARPKSGAKLH